MDDLCDPEKMYESIKISSYVRAKNVHFNVEFRIFMSKESVLLNVS